MASVNSRGSIETSIKRGGKALPKKKNGLSEEELQMLNQGLDRVILALDLAIEEARLTTQALKGAGGSA